MTKQQYPLVEVMVMNYNNEKLLDNCLGCLKRNKYPNLKVTLIDNASSDNSVAMTRKKYPFVNVVANKENLGFSKGYNDVLKKSNAQYAVLLNEDTEHDQNWISELVKIAEKDEKISALQPKVLALRDKKMFEYAGAAGGFIDIYGYPVCRGRVFSDVEEDRGQYDDVREIFWSCGVAMFVRMSVLRKIGYLDETIGAYAEELDLCWRMNLSGYKQYFVPKSLIYHLGSGVWGKKSRKFKKEYLLQRNHFIILFKNYQKKTWWRIIPIKFMLEFVTFLGFLFLGPIKSLAVLKANLWILTHIPTLNRMNKKVSKLRKIEDEKVMDKMIRRSAAIEYFLLRKKSFKDYVKYIEEY